MDVDWRSLLYFIALRFKSVTNVLPTQTVFPIVFSQFEHSHTRTNTAYIYEYPLLGCILYIYIMAPLTKNGCQLFFIAKAHHFPAKRRRRECIHISAASSYYTVCAQYFQTNLGTRQSRPRSHQHYDPILVYIFSPLQHQAKKNPKTATKKPIILTRVLLCNAISLVLLE